jgi:cytochrome P450
LRFRRDLAVLDRVVYDVIRERRAHPDGRGDLLDMLMSAVDEETGQGMDDAALRDEVMTMFLAGHETTANGLAWTFYLLSKNPAVERKLRDELEQVLGGRAPTFEDLARLRYTTMVFQESLRLYPPAWLLPRTVREDDRLGEYSVPKGAIVLLSPYVLHRHPRYWNNPEGFDPERFENEKPGPLQRYTYFPFGAGPRQCIGSAFATLEAQLIMARVLQRYRLELVPTRKVEPEALITLRPKNGMWMRIR